MVDLPNSVVVLVIRILTPKIERQEETFTCLIQTGESFSLDSRSALSMLSSYLRIANVSRLTRLASPGSLGGPDAAASTQCLALAGGKGLRASRAKRGERGGG